MFFRTKYYLKAILLHFQETVDKLQDKVSELEVELKHTQSSVPQHVQVVYW